VALQLDYIFAGKGIGAGAIKQQALVDDGAIGSTKTGERSLAWRDMAATNRKGELAEFASRDPHHPDATTPWGGGNRGDGVSTFHVLPNPIWSGLAANLDHLLHWEGGWEDGLVTWPR
jgi:hypothetical protein